MLLSQEADAFLASVRRVRLAFDGPAPKEIRCEGMLRFQSDGRDASISIRNFDEKKTLDGLKTYRPTGMEVEPLQLEDAFVEYVCGAERGNV